MNKSLSLSGVITLAILRLRKELLLAGLMFFYVSTRSSKSKNRLYRYVLKTAQEGRDNDWWEVLLADDFFSSSMLNLAAKIQGRMWVRALPSCLKLPRGWWISSSNVSFVCGCQALFDLNFRTLIHLPLWSNMMSISKTNLQESWITQRKCSREEDSWINAIQSNVLLFACFLAFSDIECYLPYYIPIHPELNLMHNVRKSNIFPKLNMAASHLCYRTVVLTLQRRFVSIQPTRCLHSTCLFACRWTISVGTLWLLRTSHQCKIKSWI